MWDPDHTLFWLWEGVQVCGFNFTQVSVSDTFYMYLVNTFHQEQWNYLNFHSLLRTFYIMDIIMNKPKALT